MHDEHRNNCRAVTLPRTSSRRSATKARFERARPRRRRACARPASARQFFHAGDAMIRLGPDEIEVTGICLFDDIVAERDPVSERIEHLAA